jgi:hypothetical protein
VPCWIISLGFINFVFLNQERSGLNVTIYHWNKLNSLIDICLDLIQRSGNYPRVYRQVSSMPMLWM